MAEELKDGPWVVYDRNEKKPYSFHPSHRTAITASVGPNNQAKANGQEGRYAVLPNLNWRKK